MRRRLMTLLVLMVLLFTVHAGHAVPYWTDMTDKPVVCCDDRVGCQVLQMVMMGSFSEFDASDSLNARIMSAALPVLKDVEDEDIEHFCGEFDIAVEEIQHLYYISLGNCLWTDICADPVDNADTEAARQLLLLFIDPHSQPRAADQMALIRENTDEALIETLSDRLGVPAAFVEYIIFTDNWQVPG